MGSWAGQTNNLALSASHNKTSTSTTAAARRPLRRSPRPPGRGPCPPARPVVVVAWSAITTPYGLVARRGRAPARPPRGQGTELRLAMPTGNLAR